jgi:hypothetical protein
MHNSSDPYNSNTSNFICMCVTLTMIQPYASLIHKMSGIDEIID